MASCEDGATGIEGRAPTSSRGSGRAAGVLDDGERGAGTVLVLGLVAVVVILLTALTMLVRVTDARGRAQAAADLGALAAAAALQRGEEPCVVAARAVDANGARLVQCAVTAPEVVVRADVDVGPALSASARARAGPAHRAATVPSR